MLQIISDTPKIMFLTCFTIRTQIIQFWIAVSYTRYAIVTITRKIVGSEALKSKAFATLRAASAVPNNNTASTIEPAAAKTAAANE